MGFDGPPLREACQEHHQTGYDLESTGEGEEGRTQDHVAQRHGGRNAEAVTAGRRWKRQPEPGVQAGCR